MSQALQNYEPAAAKSPSSGFQWEDPFLLDDQLTDDERMIRDTARAYAQERLLPRVIEIGRAHV